MAKGQRLKPEQIVTLLRQIDVLTTNGKTLAQACKEVGTVEQSYYSWRKIYSGMKVDQARIRMLTMIDEYTRKCLTIHCASRIGSVQVIEQLANAMIENGISEYIRSDNGPEFIAKELHNWLSGIGVKTAYIEPGSPWENGFCESFNGTFRDNLLDWEIFYSLKEARSS